MLIDHIYKNLYEERKNNERKFHISPYNAGDCAEKLRRQLAGEKLDIPPGILLRFEVGNAFHEKIQSLLFKYRASANYVYKKSEKDVNINYKDMTLYGRLDFYFKLNNEYYIADFKTVTKENFKYIKDRDEEDEEKNLTQLSLYAYALNTKRILLVYICIDTSEFLEKHFERRDDLIEKVYQKYKAIQENRDLEEFSPAASWECGYCSFKNDCVYRKRKEYFKDKAISVDNKDLRKIEDEYIELKKQADEVVAKLEHLKNIMINLLDFEKANRYDLSKLTISKVCTEYVNYDKKKLEKFFDHKTLELAKTIKKSEYFKISEK